MTLNN